MKYIVTINNNSYEVDVEQREARVVKTNETAAAPVAARTVTGKEAPVNSAPAASVDAPDENKITAPMPGTILEIKKSAGEPVKKGDIVFILEAMKMENEIMSPRDGIILQVAAAVGASVDTGDILAVMQ